jgi:hypothetical protein
MAGSTSRTSPIRGLIEELRVVPEGAILDLVYRELGGCSRQRWSRRANQNTLEQPIACFCSPFPARGRAVRLDMRPVDHLRRIRPTARRQRAEQPFPDAAFGPADEPVIDRRRWAIFWRAVLPAADALQHMQDSADRPPIIRPFLARTSVGRCSSIRGHSASLSQYKFVRIFSAPLTAENQQPILQAIDLLSFHPRLKRLSYTQIKRRWLCVLIHTAIHFTADLRPSSG